MYDYSHFRGYLHSRQIRWSYGAPAAARPKRGRAASPLLDQLVDALVAAGFAGIYVDRKGQEAGAETLVTGLLRKIPQEPVTNRDGTLLFFRLPVPTRRS